MSYWRQEKKTLDNTTTFRYDQKDAEYLAAIMVYLKNRNRAYSWHKISKGDAIRFALKYCFDGLQVEAEILQAGKENPLNKDESSRMLKKILGALDISSVDELANKIIESREA